MVVSTFEIQGPRLVQGEKLFHLGARIHPNQTGHKLKNNFKNHSAYRIMEIE